MLVKDSSHTISVKVHLYEDPTLNYVHHLGVTCKIRSFPYVYLWQMNKSFCNGPKNEILNLSFEYL